MTATGLMTALNRRCKMSYEAWNYFLSIEKDFIRTIDFVHLDAANAGAFSNEYAKLILLLGSEIDVVAKMLCHKLKERLAKDPSRIIVVVELA